MTAGFRRHFFFMVEKPLLTNKDIARVLYEMAILYDMEGVAFKPRAYEKAALAVEAHGDNVAEQYQKGGVDALTAIPGVGKGIAEHIVELVTRGTFREYQRLKKEIPVNVTELTAVEGVGPKMVKALWEQLRIRSLADLERAARAGNIRALPHFGARREASILKGIEFLHASGGRRVLGFVLPEVRALEGKIRSFPGVECAVIAGSVRRRKETIGDIDILAVSQHPEAVMERFVALGEVAHVYARGVTKTLVRLNNGLDADLRVVPAEAFGSALNYFTGSKAHNVSLREIALKRGWKLNEYGLYDGKRRIAGETEEALYRKLGLNYIEPELREDTGEIEAARKNKLPDMIDYGDLKGDLQIQTDWTDGENSIEEMAAAAKKAGLEYIAITDHTKSLAMTGGADEKKLARQGAEIDRLNKKGLGVRLLKGAEVNIGKDGTLDINDHALQKLDVVGASVHSHFTLPRTEQTKRVIRAMENPHVDIIFHLTGRLIGKREPIEIDVDEIIKVAKKTGTILEINASPERADVKDEYVRKCVEAGVKLSIDSDAHAASHFQFLEFGIAQARRGWATKKDVVNTRPLREFLRCLK